MANNWIKFEVFNFGTFIGSFYADVENKYEAFQAINKEFGEGNWDRYDIGN